MSRICRRCRRANPGEAVYCHHDGALLEGHEGHAPPDGRAVDVGARPFSAPLIFPSGRTCHNINQLALACREEPAEAVEMLQGGHLDMFLAAQGRSDLAAAARAAAGAPDRERGLDDFLGRLPQTVLTPASLQVEPAVLDLGTLRPGEDRRCELVLRNVGQRLLYGAADCTGTAWLALGDDTPLKRKLIQFDDRLVLTVRVLGQRLHGYAKPLEGEVRLETSGGTVTVPVRLTVPVRPFAEGVLAGARSPRQLAEKARAATKEAAVLLENGAVARWYQDNGWTWPVRGPTASGIAALQQFFEALGLAKPPRVELSQDSVRLTGRPGEKLESVLTVISQENRPALGYATSDQAWLTTGKTDYRGRNAVVPLLVPAVPDCPGTTLQANLTVVGNGNRQFTVPVTLTVAGAAPAPRPVPVPPPSPVTAPAWATEAVSATVFPQPAVASPQAVPAPAANSITVVLPTPAPAATPTPGKEPPSRRQRWLTLGPALVLGLILLAIVLRDFLSSGGRSARANQEDDPVPRIELLFHDTKKNDVLDRVWLTDPQPTQRFGLVMLEGGKEVGSGARLKRLTFDPWGRTNNACLRFDANDDRLFGGPRGSWVQSAVRNWEDSQGRHDGVKSVWMCDDHKVEVTQLVELVRGEQSRLLDTCLIRYRIANKDTKAHQVGLRFLLDTYIGLNDGVPFTIPGAADLCDTSRDLAGDKVPGFLQALERPNLSRPGTVAHVRLKLDRLEPPSRVTLGAWPSEKLRVLAESAGGPGTLWDVPVLSLKALGLNDSAVTIYWDRQPLEPGKTREVGFEYGLRSLASAGSRLALLADGAFRPEGELTILAYVAQTGDDREESVTLVLPDGFTLVDGARTQSVPRLAAGAKSGNRPVTWKVRAGRTGRYQLSVTTGSGLSQTLPVEIKGAIFD